MFLSFVIPAFNEEKTVGSVVRELKEAFPEAEVIVVDDGSTDGTYEAAVKSGADLVLKHENNQGAGMSVITGIKNAKGRYCMVVDADGQHPISEVKKVVKALDGEVDAVFTQRQSLTSSGWFKAIGKFILIRVTNFFVKKKFKDINSGLLAIKREKILNYLDLLPRRYSFPTALIIIAHLLKFKVKFVDIQVSPRKAGSSKVKLKDFLRALFIILSTVVVFEPLYFFIPLAIYSFYGAIAGGLISLFFPNILNPMGFIRFTEFSIIMFIIGLVSNQISIVIRRLLEVGKITKS